MANWLWNAFQETARAWGSILPSTAAGKAQMSFWAIFPVSAVIAGPLCTFWCWNIKPAGPQSCCNLCWLWNAFRQRANSNGWNTDLTSSLLSVPLAALESSYLNALSSPADCSNSHTRALCREGAVITVLSVSWSTAYLSHCKAQHCLFPQKLARDEQEQRFQKKHFKTGLNSILPVFPETTRADTYLGLNALLCCQWKAFLGW